MLGAPSASAESLHCSLCRSPIEGQYTRFEELDLNACSTCAASPACATCGLPLAGRLEGEGGHCTRCVRSAPRCATCGLPVYDSYWTIAGTEGHYCARCMEEAPACSACKVPSRDGTVRDGRFFCKPCKPNLVAADGAYEGIYRRTIERAREVLGLELEREPRLVVESSSDLHDLRHGDATPSDLCGLYFQDGRGNQSIHVLSHLTEARASAVLAHELAHAWQAENCPEDQGTRLREGFAEWVAWKLLERQDYDAEREVISSRTDEYGLGFRLFAQLEQRQGVDGVLWYARSASGSP